MTPDKMKEKANLIINDILEKVKIKFNEIIMQRSLNLIDGKEIEISTTPLSLFGIDNKTENEYLRYKRIIIEKLVEHLKTEGWEVNEKTIRGDELYILLKIRDNEEETKKETDE